MWMFNGKAIPDFAVSTAGSDGTSIGTIISFMGTKAPKDYLICDGATYSIADHNDLAEFFAEQFGSANFFGGDGVATFAVPDLRNMFLRGYYGDSEEQLSGEIGERQEATEHIQMLNDPSGIRTGLVAAGNTVPKNIDSFAGEKRPGIGVNKSAASAASWNPYYTSRPINTAVLYCIKTVKSIPMMDEYDTDDGWHVRKYSDGYVEMSYNEELPCSWTTSTGGLSVCLVAPSSQIFPVALVQKYTESHSIDGSSGLMWCGTLKNDFGTSLTVMQKTYMITTYPNTSSAVLSITVTGRWKA